MVNVSKETNLDGREKEAEEFLEFLRPGAPQLAEQGIVLERRDNIVGLRRGRFILLQMIFGVGNRGSYRVCDGFMELDKDPAFFVDCEDRGAAFREFHAAVPRVVESLRARQGELIALGAI